MFIREAAENNPPNQWRPGVRRDYEDRDFASVCRLQSLIGELLVKNELLRRELHRNGLIVEKLQQLVEAKPPGRPATPTLIEQPVQASAMALNQNENV